MKKTPTVYVYDDDVPLPSFDGKYRVLDIKIIKYMTARIRRIFEYREFIGYLKRTMDINKCSFYKDYSMDNGFIIELHHSPLCLFDIVEAVATKHYRLDAEDPHFEPWKVEEEVNYLHYSFKVGLVPLNPTAHKLVHSGSLKIHPRMVEGNWRSFFREYEEYMSDEARGKIVEFNAMMDEDPDKVPDIVKYTPTMIQNTTYKGIESMDVEKLIVEKLKSRFLEKQQSLEGGK